MKDNAERTSITRSEIKANNITMDERSSVEDG